MRHITRPLTNVANDVAGRFRRQASSQTPTALETALLPNGLPQDKTICPQCRNNPRQKVGCPVCEETGTVCPMCRGARLVAANRRDDRIQTPYRACECMVAVLDEQGRPERGEAGRPKFRLDEQRELDLILRYRDGQRRAAVAEATLDDDDIPF